MPFPLKGDGLGCVAFFKTRSFFVGSNTGRGAASSSVSRGSSNGSSLMTRERGGAGSEGLFCSPRVEARVAGVAVWGWLAGVDTLEGMWTEIRLFAQVSGLLAGSESRARFREGVGPLLPASALRMAVTSSAPRLASSLLCTADGREDRRILGPKRVHGCRPTRRLQARGHRAPPYSRHSGL
jgi:hypothetical protein